jgi:hypothetical protein
VIVEVLLSNGRPPEANEFRARGQSDLSSGFSYDHRLAVCVLFRTHLYLDQTATETAIVVAILLTDHLFSPIGTTVKQLTFARPQLVQNPWALSFHVPPLLVPDCARGSRALTTRLSYCDHECYAGHRKIAVPALQKHARAS